MKSKLKKIFVPFAFMIIFKIIFSLDIFLELGIVSPHVGLLFVFGLLFGPYGALGATSANIIIDLINGFYPIEIIPSSLFTFGVSYLAYKLWYSSIRGNKITKPRLNNIYHVSLFLSIILLCGFIYSVIHANLLYIILQVEVEEYFSISYFLNFINVAFIFGIISVWLSKRIDFIEIPKKSKRRYNKRVFQIILSLLIIVLLFDFFSLIWNVNMNITIAEVILSGILLFTYLTKPLSYEVEESEENTIIENITTVFLAATLVIAILGVAISYLNYGFIENLNNLNSYIYLMPVLIISDAIIVLFFIPGIIILKYVELKVIEPISSFSEVEKFIKEDEKIESEGLVDVYSRYVNEKSEIGTLARSYTELIKHNNNYIQNIREIEGEKERIKAELDIATKIQAANLPTEAIVTEQFIVEGYSHPAKEVGGDFFDYYELDDDNLVIVIGDASGKGVPAAILAMISQVIIRQFFQHERDTSKILYSLNNQLCENNPESMFLTLWLGIYNKTTQKLTFSNAGHNPPLINENGEFKYLDIHTGIVLGIMEDFEYEKEEISLTNEIVLYTDGITDANNQNNEMYGEDRLLKFFNDFEGKDNPIKYLLEDISGFTGDAEQYDDMTLTHLKIKHD